MSLKTIVVEVESPNFTGKLIVLTKHSDHISNKIKTETILGYLNPQGDLEAGNFVVNKSFLATIESYFRSKEGEAILTGADEEWLYVIDARSRSNSAPPEYIVGAYKLGHGKKLEFTMNPNYRVLTSDGFSDFGETENADFTEYVWSHPHQHNDKQASSCSSFVETSGNS